MITNNLVLHNARQFSSLPRVAKSNNNNNQKKENVFQILREVKEKYNLQTQKDWDSITRNHIVSVKGGNKYIQIYSLSKLKSLGYPKGEFNKNKRIESKPKEYWENKENIFQFLDKLKEKYSLKTEDDWNLLTKSKIKLHGGNSLLLKYSLQELKSLGFPNGNFKQRKIGYWDDQNNVHQFLNEIKQKYNLKTPKDWNLLTKNNILSESGSSLFRKYSLYDLKCLGCPEGKDLFSVRVQSKTIGYWNKKENIFKFLDELKEKLNLNTFDDWNFLKRKAIHEHGGGSLLTQYSMYDLKCLAFPDGKSRFTNSVQLKPEGYWEKQENIDQFLNELKEKLNLVTFEDWSSLRQEHIYEHGGGSLFTKYSMYDLKCLGFPDGKHKFKTKKVKFWDKNENVFQFLNELKEKLNLNTFEDWNSLKRKTIHEHGGGSLFRIYSLYDLKCLGFPDGKNNFKLPIESKPEGYWEKRENIDQFLNELKENLNLKTFEDWNLLRKEHIYEHGGGSLFIKYSMYDLKCLGFPDGKLHFDKPSKYKPAGYWDDNNNILLFLDQLKENFTLKTQEDWNRLSKEQIESFGGSGLLKKYSLRKIIQFKSKNNLSKPSNKKVYKRSSQRWLFLQVQKLFPHEEIVEDYFHPEISRESGFSVQFDIFLIHKNIAIEYHGKQHYEDIPSNFAPLELYKNRDEEKHNLCKKYGIQLIVIPYWWDNNLDSLKQTLDSSLTK